MNQIKVGDELAFRDGFSGKWEIHRVEKITPSGRIKVGRWELNPDLRVRGDKRYWGPYEGRLVTNEIREEMREREKRAKLYEAIGNPNWRSLSVDQLERIAAILAEET